jgi:hypothetical protein
MRITVASVRRMSTRKSRFALRCSISVLAACGSSASTVCTTDDQCASHFCRADGTCDPAPVDGSEGSGSNMPDGGSTALCVPNHDGMISANEVPLAANKMANFRIATSATWSTQGTASTGNTRTWSLTGALANDADRAVTLDAPAGKWWAGDPGFATATYATTLAAGSDLQGVFHVDSTGVTLLGVVSPSGGSGYTEVTYTPPARILAVPFGASSTWTTTSNVVGYATSSSVTSYVNYQEKYVSNVDQTGTMATPYGEFPVLRVGTVLTQFQTGFAPYLTVRSYAWIAECFGSVATATSTPSETNTEFSNDAEVRRLIP